MTTKTKPDTETLAQFVESACLDTYHHGAQTKVVADALTQAAERLRELQATVDALRADSVQ